MVRILNRTNAPVCPTDFIDYIPVDAALIDRDGVVFAVNEKWHRHALEEVDGLSDGNDLGENYLDAWRRRAELICPEATRIAAGLERLLKSETDEFSHLFARSSTSKTQWYRMVASHADNAHGVVVMLFPVEPDAIHDDVRTLYRHEADSGATPPQGHPQTDQLFERLLPVYQRLLRDSLSRQGDGRYNIGDQRSVAIGKQLAAGGVDAGFVLRLHVEALRELRGQSGNATSKWVSVESRMVFISVLGFLTNHYREALLGTPTS